MLGSVCLTLYEQKTRLATNIYLLAAHARGHVCDLMCDSWSRVDNVDDGILDQGGDI